MNIYQRIVLVIGGIVLALVLLEGASEGATEVVACGVAVIAFKSRK